MNRLRSLHDAGQSIWLDFLRRGLITGGGLARLIGDVLYVEELVGGDTVNTMPEATLDAFRAHGRVRPEAVRRGIDEADAALSRLAEHEIALESIAAQLLVDGLAAFDADLAKVTNTIESKLE